MALDELTEELARSAAGGDHRALGELLARIEPDVMRHCARILPYHQDAEEASQDTLLAVARNIGRFEGRARFSTWLHIVTANCARTTYRTLKRRAAEQSSDEL
ncbi:RNA polymerase sigma factor, partial [Nonomuraea fuscirosea]